MNKTLKDFSVNVDRIRREVHEATRAEFEDWARERVAQWMITNGYVTGHGDTLEDLLTELVRQ